MDKQRLGSHLCSDTSFSHSRHWKVTCRTQSAPCIFSKRPALMSPGPNAPLFPPSSSQSSLLVALGTQEVRPPSMQIGKRKKRYLGLSLEEQQHHSEGAGHGVWGIFSSKEIYNGCVVQRKENLNEKARETCRTRILLSRVTKLSSRAAQVCGQCFN